MVQPPNYSNGGGRMGGAAGSAGLSATLGTNVLPRVLIIMVCSFVLFLQSVIYSNRTLGDGGAENYGIAVGIISFVFSAAYLFLAKKKPSTFSNWVLPKVRGELSITHLYTGFTALWWSFAAAILTFGHPFNVTSNAYFAIWAATATSYLLLGKAYARVQIAMRSMSAIQERTNVKALAGLAISSAIVLFAAIEFVGITGEASFAIVIGVLSTCVSSLMYYMVDREKVGAPLKKAFSAVLLLLWGITACVLTFDGPFNATGNGYFGTWASLFFATAFAWQELVGGEVPMGIIHKSFAFDRIDDESAAPPMRPAGLDKSPGDVA